MVREEGVKMISDKEWIISSFIIVIVFFIIFAVGSYGQFWWFNW